MKKEKTSKKINKKLPEATLKFLPFRYVLAFIVTAFKVLVVIGAVVWLSINVKYFYFIVLIAQFLCTLKIIASDTNPDYKVPWLLFVLILPIVGFLLYIIFSSTTLRRKYVRKFKELKDIDYKKDDSVEFLRLKEENVVAYNQAFLIKKISNTNLFCDTKTEYFSSGEDYKESLLEDLKNAKKFIYLEFFIIKKGVFWKEIYSVLKEKAKDGVEVKIVYDDIGCMLTLPSYYYKTLKKDGIKAIPFSRLKGRLNSEFNNRSHRKIVVIDGYIGYTGGINIGDEYINLKHRYGHWKDCGIKLTGKAVYEFTKLFLIDYAISSKDFKSGEKIHYPPTLENLEGGYVMPFGDGPKPLYTHDVGKSVIQTMLYSAKKYAFITTPYLIIDNDMCQTIEDTALRGVDVKIIVPKVPDKKIINYLTKSYYERLINAGVKIYEYEKGFIHAKSYLIDDEYAMLGTINLDYRSLVHHFENGVWMYNTPCIKDVKEDFIKTLNNSEKINDKKKKQNVFQKLICALIKVFSPLM